MLWVLAWLMSLIGCVITAIAFVFNTALAIDEENVRRVMGSVALLFLVALLGWCSWAASFMS